MPDVLKIAMERRAALLEEISSLDRFVKTANALLADGAATEAKPLPAPAAAAPAPSAAPAPRRVTEPPRPARTAQAASADEPAAPATAPQMTVSVKTNPPSGSVKSGLSRTEAFLRDLKVLPTKAADATNGRDASQAPPAPQNAK